MNHVVKKQQGFTLIELMLAMTFVSFLLLGIAMTIIQVGAIYNQGTTTKEINQASREINDDLRRNISAAGLVTIADDYALNPTSAVSEADASGGRLCLGTYSYIWNYAKAIQSKSAADANMYVTKYEATAAQPNPGTFQLIKVPDTGRVYCAKNGVGALTYRNIRADDVPRAQELLKTGDHSLGVHHLSFLTPVPASANNDVTGQRIYSLTYVIGTSPTGALNPTQTACLPAGEDGADPLYCNVQQFSLVVRAGNGVN